MDHGEVIGNIRSLTHNAESHKTLKKRQKGYVNSNKKKIPNRSEKFLFCYKGMDHGKVIGNSLTLNAESDKTLKNVEKRVFRAFWATDQKVKGRLQQHLAG